LTIVVNLTISLPKETLKMLRRTVKERYGGRKGALSGLIKEALEEHIGSLSTPRPVSRFVAFERERQVGEAASLDDLTSRLEDAGIDPRAFRIISSTPLRQIVRAGLRGKSL